MVVKSKVEFKHINDLEDIFEILKRHKLRLNAAKCSFRVSSGKFLGYIWLPTVELKSTHIKLEQSTNCSLLGILKRSRS